MPPLYKIFSTPENHYILDTPTGRIVKVGEIFKSVFPYLFEENTDEQISNITSMPLAAIKEVRTQLTALHESKVLLDIESVQFLSKTFSKQYGSSIFPLEIKNIAFKVTNQCNMSCCYCFQHGLGQPRKASNGSMMTQTIAQSGVDLLMVNSDFRKGVTISFYGGEPFLNFELISSIVKYVADTYPNREVGYIVTSNGTAVTDEIVQFLIKHRFGFLLSIDGPYEINDRYRRMKDNSKSQYVIAMDFLRRVRKTDKKYADGSIKLCMTLAPPLDYTYIADFVDELGIEPVVNLCDQSEFPPDVRIQWKAVHQEELFGRFMNLVEEYSPVFPDIPYELYRSFEFGVFFSLLKAIHNRRVGEPMIEIGTLGFCIPGKVKPIVHPDGYIYVCEKVEGLKSCRIGHIETGFDKETISTVFKKYEQIDMSKCKRCWLVNMCPICLFHIVGTDGISETRRSFYCDSIKRNISKGLEFYTQSMESIPAKISALLSSIPES